MATQSSRRIQSWSSSGALLLGLALAFTGCASGNGSVSGSVSGSTTPGGSGTASVTTTHVSGGSAPTATPRPAPPHAFAWYQFDSHSAPQIWASVNGASPVQITHIAPPDPNGCDNELAWSPPVFSPDLTHIVAAVGGYGCGDGDLSGSPSVIAVSGGAVTNVPTPTTLSIRLTERDAGWLDAHTIWFIGGDGNAYTYQLGAASSTQLPGISGATEGAVRGATFFWQSFSIASTAWSYTIHRYDLGAHSALAGSVNQGAWGACQCSPGDLSTPGWDASPDGSHLAYQVVTPSSSASGGITSSHIYYSAADGSGASQIARAMVTNALIKMQISPDGHWVAFTQAAPTPATLTASVSSPGGSGDTTFHGYSPDTYDYPVWKWDSSQFWAASGAAPGNPGSGSSGSLYRFNLGGSSSVGVAGGVNPWYTIGG